MKINNLTKCIVALMILIVGCKVYAQSAYEPVEFGAGEVVFSSSSYRISVTDPTPYTNASGSYLPGGRGTNQLVIYTPAFGDRTNTNEYGTEAIVQDNVVTMMSGANSFIPSDGFVISGHGSAKNWIINNLSVGTKIYIENNIINAYSTSESYMFEAKEKIKEVDDMVKYYKARTSNYSWKNVVNHLQAAEDNIEKAHKVSGNQESVISYSKLALSEVNEAMNIALPYLKNELKGVWVRPTETSREQIMATLDTMQNAGINNVFLETFYHGKTIYPSPVMEKYGFTKQNPSFSSMDALKVWIEEAHKRNMKLHVWFQSFYIGNENPSSNPTNILAVRPYWSNKTKLDYQNASPTMSRVEHNGYFLDPANPEVQDFLTQLITEIVCCYHPDGINLDYIRYPQSVIKNENGSWGYSEYARNDFMDMYGEDPVSLNINDMLWRDWENYRRDHVTNFVRKVGAICKQNNVYISTVIFPDLKSALNDKQQDWRTWSKRNYVNGFTPLFLTYDSKMVAEMMQQVYDVKSPCTDLLAGIFVTFMGGTTENLIKQIHETRKLNANGVILFDYAHTTKNYIDVLAKSAFASSINMLPRIEGSKKKKFSLFGRNQKK